MTRLPQIHLAALLGAIFVITLTPVLDAEKTEKMNVLLLMIDDLNSWLLDDPDRYDGKVIAPNLRGLADSGVNFVQAYAASPVCLPSRTELLGICFFIPSAPFSPKARGRRGFDG